MGKKVIYFEDLPVEEQVDILVNSKHFWEDYCKASGDDCSLETILRRNGVTDEESISRIKEIGERRFKEKPEKYNLIIVD